jgi:immune inhibitor A
MRRVFFGLSLMFLLLFALTPTVSAQSVPPDGSPADSGKKDDLPHPLGEKQRALRLTAKEAQVASAQGNAYGTTQEVARGQFVELERIGEDPIWTVLGEFSDLPHNSIAQPDRSVDNTSVWVPDFSREHYLDVLFSEAPGQSSMRNFYIELSSNRYTVNGDVTNWTTVPGNAASYDDDLGGGAVWQFLEDTVNGWYAAQTAAGKTPAEIDAYLSQFDVWDRYDWDGDGNFNEPDGYIDHFQAVHAGEGEEAGGGILGGQAIWSHRWYARYNLIGSAGPSSDYLLGGLQVGNSSYWIGDYTIEPENGGVGVFAHEFGHDLGLPDLYATQGGENSTGFWTLMSSGSWLSSDPENIGSRPGHMGAWEKFQLGWLNYEVAFAGQTSAHKIGPAETNTKQAQGLFVVLPQKEVTANIGTPYAGSYFYYSGQGNNLDSFMYKAFNLPAGSSLTASVNFDIEVDWDYAYVVVSTDGGATWTGVPTNFSTVTDPNGQNFGNGITGSSGGWAPLTADLSAFTGDVLLGFRYWTDGAVVGTGLMIDEFSVNGSAPDSAEVDAGWTFVGGFRVSTGTETALYNHYYVAEFRQYRSHDETLSHGPYNFGYLDNPTLGNWVERFPYQDGLLISYWDTSQANNNTPQHPGQGLILPIDAHPTAMIRADGGVWRNRVQTYDSTFSLEPTDAVTLHWLSQPSEHPSLPAQSVFDDRNSYYDPANPWGSVIVPVTGTQIKIRNTSAQGNFMQVEVSPAKFRASGLDQVDDFVGSALFLPWISSRTTQ